MFSCYFEFRGYLLVMINIKVVEPALAKLKRELVADTSSRLATITEDLNVAMQSTSNPPTMEDLNPMGPRDAVVFGADLEYPINVVPSISNLIIISFHDL